MHHQYKYLDKRVISKLQGLRVAFHHTFGGMESGIHGSSSQGFNTEFLQHRDYMSGDDVSLIDWRLYGRRERLFIRQFQEDTNSRLIFLLDLSRSMYFNSSQYMQKVEYAKCIISHLSYFLLNQNDQVGLAFFDESLLRFLKPKGGRKQIHNLIKELRRAPEGEGTHLLSAIKQSIIKTDKRSVLVVLSDFIDSVLQENHTAAMSVSPVPLIAVKINDPMECSLEGCGTRYREFYALEGNGKVSADPSRIRTAYIERFNAHHKSVRDYFCSKGHSFFSLNTAQRLDQIVLALITALRRCK